MHTSTALLLSILLIACSCQFSSFVNGFNFREPQTYSFQEFVANALDNYLGVDQKISPKATFGVDDQTDVQESFQQTGCRFPFVFYQGQCQCPRGGRFAFGKCLGARPQDYATTQNQNQQFSLTDQPNSLSVESISNNLRPVQSTNQNFPPFPNPTFPTFPTPTFPNFPTFPTPNFPTPTFPTPTRPTPTRPTPTPPTPTQPEPQPTPFPIGGTKQCPIFQINAPRKTGGIQDLAFISRTYDGTNNNQQNQNWGSANSFLQRRLPANYKDGIGQPISNLPGARAISNAVGSQSGSTTNNHLSASILFVIFGQFIDHDIDLTPSGSSQPMNIPIPRDDRFFAGQSQLGFTRSQADIFPGQPRRHRNVITSWLDGSQIYGSDNETSCALRLFKNGKLKFSQGPSGEFLLPKFGGFFRAGDARAIENSILVSIQTIFMREHNRVCDEVLRKNPKFNDETVFQIARNFVIGLYQKIVLKDFLPIMMGDKFSQIIGQYNGYRSNVNPNIPTEFSTASYRIGHSLLPNSIPQISKNRQVVTTRRLNELFMNQDIISETFIEQILRGSSQTVTKEKSPQLVDDVRNLLVLDISHREVKLDLFSLNIQRGRDHGLQSYNTVRSAFNLNTLRNFADLLPNNDVRTANQLKSVYNTTDNIQLFVGIIAERPVNNGILGDLGAEIVGQTFRNLRDGDRFWYQLAYPQAIRQEIDNTSFGDIIRRNCKNADDFPSNVFIAGGR